MGYIKELVKSPRTPFASGRRTLWDRAFGTRDDSPPRPQPDRSITSTGANVKRFLETLRSRVPGGWSDDRWEESRHYVGITYIALHRIGLQLMQAEFKIFHKDPDHPDGKRAVVQGESEYRAVELFEKPNGKDSFGTMLYRINQQLGLTGTSLEWMVPNGLSDRIVELYVIPTALAIPLAVQTPDLPNGGYQIQPIYPYGPFSSSPSPYSAVGARIPSEWMVQIQYPHPLLWYDGYSPLTGLRLQIDSLTAIERARWYSQFRQINPSAVLQMDGEQGAAPLTDDQIERIAAEFEASFQGPENAGKLYVTTPGARLEQFGNTPDKMLFESGWDQLTDFCLAAQGITKPAAGMVSESSYATLYAAIKQLNVQTLDPICQLIASNFTRHVLPFFGDDLVMEIRVRRIDDHDQKKQKVDTLITAKAITKNEVRREFEMDPTDESWGEEIAGEGGQEGQEGMMGAPEPPELGMDEMGDQDERAMANSADNPGKLSAGSLGPRKSLGELLGQRLPDYTLSNGYREEQRPIVVQPILNVTMPGGETQRVGTKELSMANNPVGVHYTESGPPVIHVHVPEQPAPVIHVHVPEQPAPTVEVQPVVKVEMPARQSKKTIRYSPEGWPVQVDEVEKNAEEP